MSTSSSPSSRRTTACWSVTPLRVAVSSASRVAIRASASGERPVSFSSAPCRRFSMSSRSALGSLARLARSSPSRKSRFTKARSSVTRWLTLDRFGVLPSSGTSPRVPSASRRLPPARRTFFQATAVVAPAPRLARPRPREPSDAPRGPARAVRRCSIRRPGWHPGELWRGPPPPGRRMRPVRPSGIDPVLIRHQESRGYRWSSRADQNGRPRDSSAKSHVCGALGAFESRPPRKENGSISDRAVRHFGHRLPRSSVAAACDV